MRSAKSVVDEMELISKMGIGEIEIMDDTFTFDRQRVIDICKQLIYIKPDWSVDFNIRTRVDKVDLPMLTALKLAGCKRINYGIESYIPETLKTLRKGFEVKDIDKALYWTKQVGIESQAYLMLGSPDETKWQMQKTIQCVNEANPDYAYYSLTSPMPGTAMYERGLKEGRYIDYWRDFARNPDPEFKMKIWQEDDRDGMVKLMEHGYRSFYYRPQYVLKKVFEVRSMGEFMRKAKMAVGMMK
jgi:radical SAM superfamily enzyme YgiQ (UPF0313 family)